ncbi:MAG: hypothetical protein ABI442_07290 [Gemmatimonadaceae bacterium]
MAVTSLPERAVARDISFRGVMRMLAVALPELELAGDAGREPSLAALARPTEPARVISATLVEDGRLRARAVPGNPTVGFGAFLDGTQASRAVYYGEDGAPVVHGTAAAVVRVRREGRLFTWKHVVESRLYADRRRIPAAVWSKLSSIGLEIRDTSDSAEPGTPFDHPFALRDAAIHRLQKDREKVEESLASQWCSAASQPLLIDGGISGADAVAKASLAIGVIKSHRTLYAEGDALARVFALARGERSSVFRVTSPKRTTVASWYLRMRDRRAQDPMWGLVRVEVANADAAERELTARADEVSRWILAEATPIALPDGRWDKMVYGIRDCEEFLKAVT